tara:strand:- start:610 stop:1032 length:423 start_codon:yes stop_codon:yes gene_type:complete
MNIQIAQKLKASDLDDKSLLQMFIKLRDRRAQRKAAFDADDATDKEKQSGIEVEFLRRFNERGIDNVSSREYGTAYRSTRSSVTIADWDIFLKHVKKNEAWELLEHRANKKNAQEYTEVHGEIVPGTKYSETQVVNFRRK